MNAPKVPISVGAGMKNGSDARQALQQETRVLPHCGVALQVDIEIERTPFRETPRQTRADYGGRDQREQKQQRVQPITLWTASPRRRERFEQTAFETGRRQRGVAIG
jgi:hypothetical protein